MAPIIGLAAVIVIAFILFHREIAKRDLSPLVAFLLVIAIVMLTHNDGKTLELGPTLWKSFWLPQMLSVVIIFLLYIVPGPRIIAMLKEKAHGAHHALKTTLIGILVCVLLGLITMTVSSKLPFLGMLSKLFTDL